MPEGSERFKSRQMSRRGRPLSGPGRNREGRGDVSLVQPLPEAQMRAIALWMLGIPIPIIILLYLFDVI
jgi:hypothetical protein